MSLSHHLWLTHRDLARQCLTHPFVAGIAAGTLPRDRFAFYVGQDAFFLRAFASAYSVSAARSPDFQGFETFHQLAGGVLEELKLHRGYAAQWGIDLDTVQPAAATRHYTDFLLATAWGRDVGLTAVVMAPCMRLYAFLGQELTPQSVPDTAYADWLRTYSQPEFEALAQQLEALVDRYASPTPEATAAYGYAMQCERDFFQAAWVSAVPQ